jgi:hypothetical protein
MPAQSYRIGTATITLAVVATLTTGCTPEFRGQIGLTRTSTGALMAVVLTCGARFDGANLVDGTVERDHYERLGLWKHDRALPATATWSITGDLPGGTWTTIRSWNGEVPQGRRYVLQAGRIVDGMVSQSDAVSFYLTFSSEDLDGLPSGMVLRRGTAGTPDSPVLQSFDDFISSACRQDD